MCHVVLRTQQEIWLSLVFAVVLHYFVRTVLYRWTCSSNCIMFIRCVSHLPTKYTASSPSPSPPLLPLSGLALTGTHAPGLSDEVDGALHSCGGESRGIPCEVLHSGPYRAAAGKEATGAGSGVGSGGEVEGVRVGVGRVGSHLILTW